MRHYFKFRSFGSSNSYRKSLFINLCNCLIKYEFLNIGLLKAKELKIFLEPIITISKNYSNFNFKFLYKKIKNIDTIFKLFKIIGPRYVFKNGGYLKIYKNGFRKGDNSSTCIISFV
ncbi:50S ribosomal subunit protein L17 [Candidatus Nasuia deltocephalinicola str. NAS-ALF]|uniref:50S ribosomal protein L17 n=1 Tax=Candidatus Nasuia deltocephalinicola str. NAS-ALF TaxID=1343077 RepID=S5SY28_9PROT|nr:50S ribosomal subunit protein L17 [Candidatus Nasuia deltocephalinicola str. NAS-ALF]